MFLADDSTAPTGDPVLLFRTNSITEESRILANISVLLLPPLLLLLLLLT
jgi:hypothetical protein